MLIKVPTSLASLLLPVMVKLFDFPKAIDKLQTLNFSNHAKLADAGPLGGMPQAGATNWPTRSCSPPRVLPKALNLLTMSRALQLVIVQNGSFQFKGTFDLAKPQCTRDRQPRLIGAVPFVVLTRA